MLFPMAMNWLYLKPRVSRLKPARRRRIRIRIHGAASAVRRRASRGLGTSLSRGTASLRRQASASKSQRARLSSVQCQSNACIHGARSIGNENSLSSFELERVACKASHRSSSWSPHPATIRDDGAVENRRQRIACRLHAGSMARRSAPHQIEHLRPQVGANTILQRRTQCGPF